MTTTSLSLQLKLRGIFLADDSPVKFPNPVGDIFTNIISAINSFFQCLIEWFNQEFPPESLDEQIRHWFDGGATPYLVGAAVLITCLCCWSCLLSCISAILVGCFDVVRSFFRCIGRCLCCGRRMMRAPGRSPLMMRRAAFEANPRGYFRDLRGKSNNFNY